MKIEGIAVVVKKNVLTSGDCKAPVLDRVAELRGNGIALQLVSSTHTDPVTRRGKLGKPANPEKWVMTFSNLSTGESSLKVVFDWDHSDGIPGAVCENLEV